MLAIFVAEMRAEVDQIAANARTEAMPFGDEPVRPVVEQAAFLAELAPAPFDDLGAMAHAVGETRFGFVRQQSLNAGFLIPKCLADRLPRPRRSNGSHVVSGNIGRRSHGASAKRPRFSFYLAFSEVELRGLPILALIQESISSGE
jgi:hypothetical protein